MKILHISDYQGDLAIFEKACLNDSDMVVDTGDLLPIFFMMGLIVDQRKKILDIKKFLNANKYRIIRLLKNRPFVFVQGNHDWIWLDRLDYEKLYQLNNSYMLLLKIF